jgi:hypothetical protein
MEKIIRPSQGEIEEYANDRLNETKFRLRGFVKVDHYRKGELIHTQIGENTFTTEGMAALLNIMFGTTSKAGSAIFYVGIFHTNATPGVSDTAAVCLGASGTYGESQDADYTPNTNKPAYTIASTATATCTNAASPAVFTIVVASVTIYGAFLSTAPAKTATSGYLMAAKKFGTARAVITADVLSVTYSITCTTS